MQVKAFTYVGRLVTLCDPMKWQVTLRSSEMCFLEELYAPLTTCLKNIAYFAIFNILYSYERVVVKWIHSIRIALCLRNFPLCRRVNSISGCTLVVGIHPKRIIGRLNKIIRHSIIGRRYWQIQRTWSYVGLALE